MIVVLAKFVIFAVLATFTWAFIQAWRRTKRRSRSLWRAKYKDQVTQDRTSAFLDMRHQFHPHLPVPSIEATDEGSVRMSWVSPRDYAEIEVWSSGAMEWFVYSYTEERYQASRTVEKEISLKFVEYVVKAFVPKEMQK